MVGKVEGKATVESRNAADISDFFLILAGVIYATSIIDLTNGGSWFVATTLWIVGMIIFGFSVYFHMIAQTRRRR